MLAYITLALAVAFAASYAHAAPSFIAGAARVNMTPPVHEHPTPLGGYGDRAGRPATGVHDSVYARALVVQTDEARLALVSVDLCFVVSSLKEEVLKRLPGWRSAELLLAATHSHAAPEPGAMNRRNALANPRMGVFDEWLLTYTADRIAQAIQLASGNLRAAQMGLATTQLPGYARNRRNDPIIDTQLSVLRVAATDGAPIALVVNFTAHPTILGADIMEVSAGWPGVMMRAVEAQPNETGGICLFFNGAEGDVTHLGARGATKFERMEFYGERLAERVRELIPAARSSAADAGLRVYADRVSLPERTPSRFLTEHGVPEYGIESANVSRVLDMYPPDVEVMALDWGPVTLLAVPGEMISSLGMRMKGRVMAGGQPVPLVIGLANDYLGYILDAEEYAQGGYEAAMSPYGPDLGAFIADALVALRQGVGSR